jgi:predicted DNA-binding transcriptional regulator YafY
MDPQQRRDAPRDTQGQWSRALWLDTQTRAGSHPDIAALRAEFAVSRRTAYNTVAFLRDSLGAPLAYNRARRGYYYTDPTYTLPAMFLQEGELLALLLAQQVTHQYLGTPLEAPLRAAVEKISRYLPDEALVQLQDVADAFQFAGGSRVEVPLQLVAELRRALRERRLLRLLYYTASRDETGERDIEPHFLRNVRGDWTLVAWDRGREAVREFMLARIREYQLQDERFVPRPELNRQQYAAHTFLTEHGAAPYEVVLRFDAYQARWIRERTWHPSQQIEEHADGSLTLRLTVAGEGDLLRWIHGYASHVEVLAPAWLRERVAEEVRRLGGIYGA